MDDWYNVIDKDIFMVKNGGRGLLQYHYKGSPSSALQSVYPEHNWELERFKNKPSLLKHKNDAQRVFWESTSTEKFTIIPKRFWKDKENQKKFFDWIKTRLGYGGLSRMEVQVLFGIVTILPLQH